MKGKLRKEKGGCVEGVGVKGETSDPDGPADGPELFGGESRKLAEPRSYVCVIFTSFGSPAKTYAFDLHSFPYSNCHLQRPSETVNLYLLGHDLLAIASP